MTTDNVEREMKKYFYVLTAKVRRGNMFDRPADIELNIKAPLGLDVGWVLPDVRKLYSSIQVILADGWQPINRETRTDDVLWTFVRELTELESEHVRAPSTLYLDCRYAFSARSNWQAAPTLGEESLPYLELSSSIPEDASDDTIREAALAELATAVAEYPKGTLAGMCTLSRKRVVDITRPDRS